MTVNVFTNAIPKAMVVDVEVGFNSVLLRPVGGGYMG